MAILNFPPTAGEPIDGSFTYSSDGVTYSWDGYKWTADTGSGGGGDANHSDGPTPPTTGELADQWYNTDDGRLYTYTADSSGALVWIDASPDSIAGGSGGSGDGTTVNYNGASAWLQGVGTGGAADADRIRGGHNISGVVRNSTGNYTVTFITPMSSAYYSAQATAISGARVASVLTLTPESLVVKTNDSDGNSIDTNFNLTVHESNAIAPQSGVGADAWGTFSGTTGDLQAGMNIKSTTRTSVGDYKVEFITEMPSDSEYAVTAAANSSQAKFISIREKSTSGFRVVTRDGSENISDGAVSFTVHASSTVTPTYTWTRDGTTLKPANDGDEVDFGNALVTPSGNIKAGDPDNSQGSVLSPIGQSYVRNDGGGSTDPAYAVYNGGLGSAGKFAAINFDGSAVFSQGNISFLADGSAYFGGDKGRILSDGRGFFQGNTQVAVNSSNVNGADVEGVFLSVGGSQTNTVTNTGSSTLAFRVFAKGSTSNRAAIFGNGNMNLAGVLAENASDQKFKTNIVAALSQWDDIKALQFKKWDWNDKAPGTEERKLRRNVGLVAQEAELVDPKLVFDVQIDEVEGNTYKAIDQSVLTMKLLGALQESITRIETLEETNASLEARLTALEGGNN